MRFAVALVGFGVLPVTVAHGVGCRDEFGPDAPSHWYGNRARYRVHDDRGRSGSGVRGAGHPSAHADIDGTGWVRASLDGDRITAAGQVFRMAMYHENHPDKDYKIANRVEVFEEPRVIAWQPGQESPENGELGFGGWIWRYDLAATGPSRTTVTLTYDWSEVPPHIREYIQFPPFGLDHLDISLRHLSDLVTEVGHP